MLEDLNTLHCLNPGEMGLKQAGVREREGEKTENPVHLHNFVPSFWHNLPDRIHIDSGSFFINVRAYEFRSSNE